MCCICMLVQVAINNILHIYYYMLTFTLTTHIKLDRSYVQNKRACTRYFPTKHTCTHKRDHYYNMYAWYNYIHYMVHTFPSKLLIILDVSFQIVPGSDVSGCGKSLAILLNFSFSPLFKLPHLFPIT